MDELLCGQAHMFIFIVCLLFIVNYRASSLDLVTDEKCRSSDYNELRLVLLKGGGFCKRKLRVLLSFLGLRIFGLSLGWCCEVVREECFITSFSLLFLNERTPLCY
jgi:hypothetical protein